jgi:hypothetical protein
LKNIALENFTRIGKAEIPLRSRGILPGVASKTSATLTSRDTEILETLTLKVRLLSVRQLARTWWGSSRNSEANARTRIRQLEETGFVSRFVMMAHPELPLTSPVASWEPGQEEPDFGAISYRLQSRWRLPLVSTPAVIATEGTGNRFGGKGGRVPRPSERSHDLHMSTIFLFYRDTRPDLIPFWVSEETLRAEKHGDPGKLPDALIRNGTECRVVECAGAYSKIKLMSFHEYCRGESFPYELW